MHEPCKSRSDCYHSRAGRIGNREAKARAGRIGGRIGARKTNATWGKTSEAREARARSGRIGGPIGGRNQPREVKVRAGRNGSQEAKVRAARIGGIKTAETLLQKPNRQEQVIAALLMTFHPDVWADIIWQRRLPNGLRGVPDLQHPIKVVGEYDGGAHHLFRDRSTDDTTKDAERRMAGYAVVRETDPYVLVAKFAYAVRGKFCS